jgi:uncharacterized protein with PIN domain
MLFYVDGMLGNVAKKLRLLGYNSEYISSIDDLKLIKKSKDENRMILTKDNELHIRAKKHHASSLLITKDNEIEQILEIFSKTNLKLNDVSGDIARCTKCNSLTNPIEKSMIIEQVPSGVLKNNEKFWKCTKCKKIYWEGTHIKNLRVFFKKLKN